MNAQMAPRCSVGPTQAVGMAPRPTARSAVLRTTSSSFAGSSPRLAAPCLAPRPTVAQRNIVVADAAAAAPSGDMGSDEKPEVSFLAAFWKFLRPHTIRGTILGSFSLTTRALIDIVAQTGMFWGMLDWWLVPRAILGVLALLCGNGYIVGINQIYDVDIDKVNKPFLPMAAGELSNTKAWWSCALMAVCGIGITATNFGALISGLYTFGLFLGTIYSIPPLRLKRFAVPAFMIIATVRGFLLNFGVFYATRAALGIEFAWSPPICFITGFVTLFATAIAITKDLPDVEGDRAYGIETFATRMGVKGVTALGVSLLFINYVAAVYLGLTVAGFNTTIMCGSHAILGAILLFRWWKLDNDGYDQEAIQNFYRWVWNLFYSEYALLPFL